jgi:hypothetical protein
MSRNYREVAIYLVSDSRIGDMRLRDDRNAFRRPNMGVAFSIWVNGDRSSFAVIGWPWEGMSLNSLVQQLQKTGVR